MSLAGPPKRNPCATICVKIRCHSCYITKLSKIAGNHAALPPEQPGDATACRLSPLRDPSPLEETFPPSREEAWRVAEHFRGRLDRPALARRRES